jgi:DNA-binding response OmpR family regulator
MEASATVQSGVPDLLITDVTIPGLSGVDLAVQYHSCKTLLFSGQAATIDLFENARSNGSDFFLLLKPDHPSEFLAGMRARC